MSSELSALRRYLILFTVSLSVFMATLDGSIVNIALPVMSRAFRVDLSTVQWVVTAYLITISVLLLVWGKISDLFGKKTIFAFGFLLFAAGSLLCGLSHSFPLLVASRVLQAVGASAMMALSQGIATFVFPPRERGKALGFIGTMVAVGSMVGPSLGGVVIHLFSWQAIFYLNVPVGIFGVVCTFVILPDIFARPDDKSFDIPGTLLFSGALLLVFVGLLLLQQGILPPLFLWPALALAAVCVAAFVKVERRAKNPLLELSLFRKREFSMGLLSAYLSFIALNSTLLFMPFYLQDELRYTAFQAGLLISFYPVTTALVAPFSGWLSDKISYRPLTIAGMSTAAGALLLALLLSGQSPRWFIALCLVFLGAGIAMFQSPNNSSVMGSAPREQLGVAGGVNALFRNLGMVSGTTFSALIFSFVTKLGFSSVSSAGSAGGLFLKGFRAVLLFDACCCILAALLNISRAVLTTRKTREKGIS